MGVRSTQSRLVVAGDAGGSQAARAAFARLVTVADAGATVQVLAAFARLVAICDPATPTARATGARLVVIADAIPPAVPRRRDAFDRLGPIPVVSAW